MDLLAAAAGGDVERVTQLIGPDLSWGRVLGMDLRKMAENQAIGPERQRPLIEAAANGQLELVKVLLGRKRIMPALADALGFTALHMAARNGHEEVVRVLASRPELLDVAADAGGLFATPLILAAERGRVNITNILLRSGASTDCVLTDGATALYKAAEHGHLDIVMHLLSRPGIKVNAALTVEGTTPLHAASRRGDAELVRLLLSRDDVHVNAVAADGATPLSLAADHGHWLASSLLLSRGADPNVPHVDGTFPLFVAARNGHAEVTIALLNAHAEVNATATADGMSALHAAARNGHAEVVRALLAHAEVDANVTTTDGSFALYAAACNGHAEVVRALLGRALLTDAEVDANATTTDGSFALYAAAQNGHAEVVRALLAPLRVDVNATTTDGRFALYAATSNGHVEVAKALLAQSTLRPCAALPGDGTRALHAVARNGNAALARLLLDRCRCCVDARATDGATPLMLAAEHGQVDVARELLNHGAGVNMAAYDGRTPLYVACSNGMLEFVQLLLGRQGVQPNKHGPDGSCALAKSCELDFSEIVRELLAHGADPNGNEQLVRTPLLEACARGHSACVEWLVTHELLDLNREDEDFNRNPLLAASEGGHTECVRLLINASEDLLVDARGGDQFWTPLTAANSSGFPDIVDLLLERAARAQVRVVTRPLADLYRSRLWKREPCRNVLALAVALNLPAECSAWFGSAEEKSQARAFALARDELEQARFWLAQELENNGHVDGDAILQADAAESAAVDAALAAAATLPEIRAANARQRALMQARYDLSSNLNLEPAGVYGDWAVASLALAQAKTLLAKTTSLERRDARPLERLAHAERAAKAALDAQL